jgi:hypothetical protein
MGLGRRCRNGVLGSAAELEALTGKKDDDLHPHRIDHLAFERNGKRFRRVDPRHQRERTPNPSEP